MTIESIISPDVVTQWRELLKQGTNESRKEAETFYFASILPDVLTHLDSLDHHKALRRMKFHTLVSLMGFSPETTVISTAILRPQRLVIVYSRNVGESLDRAHDYIRERGILKPRQIDAVQVGPVNHFQIYSKIREKVEESKADAGANGMHIVDITGGKKIMSATAAQAAWELNMPLCYIESGMFDPNLRRPIPGHEELICLPDPSQEKGRQKRLVALDIYERRNYKAAIEAFDESRPWNEHRVLDEFGLALCPCYSAWTDLDLTSLGAALEALQTSVDEPVTSRLLEGRLTDPTRVTRHINALAEVAKGERIALIATFLELADLYRSQLRHDFSVLLAYRSMEALVEYGLQRLGGDDFRHSRPKYEMLGPLPETSYLTGEPLHARDSPEALASEYRLLCEQTRFHGVDELPNKLGFMNGFGLLCILTGLHQRLYEGKNAMDAVLLMKAQAERRNRSVLAHGNQSLNESDSTEMLRHAAGLANAVLDPSELQRLQHVRDELTPLPLQELQEEA